MTPASAADMVRRYGETLTLKRTGQADLSLRGKIRQAAPQELVGEVALFAQRIVIANDEIAAAGWPGPPRKGDRIVRASPARTLEIQACDTRKIGDDAALHVLAVAG